MVVVVVVMMMMMSVCVYSGGARRELGVVVFKEYSRTSHLPARQTPGLLPHDAACTDVINTRSISCKHHLNNNTEPVQMT